MTDKKPDEATLFSSDHGWVKAATLQRVISSFDGPGLIYLPEGTWEESVIVTQHNLTILGEGKDTTIVNENEQSPITIIAPSVRIVNLTVRSEFDVPAVSLSHGDATQAVLQNVMISGSGSHGLYRDENYGFAIGAILNCTFQDVDEHAIFAPTGTGPRNLIVGNEGENIGGDFIRWGVNHSILSQNHCPDAPIRLTENAQNNLVLKEEDTEIAPGWPETNIVL